MARGGLASIPVRSDMFEYAGGGIIAFQEGGQPKKYETPYDRMNRENREKANEEPRVINLPKGTPADEVELIRMQNPDAVVRTEDEGSKLRDMGQAVKRGLTYSSDVEAMKQRPPPAAPAAPFEQASLRKMEPQMAPAGLPGAAVDKGIKPPVAPSPAASMAPRPAPAAPQAGLPGAAAAIAPQDEVAKLSLEAVREKAKAMTPEEAMAQEGKFATQYGLDKKFGEEERGLLALMKQRQADYAKNRPMEELGATLRGFGQGYGGASAAGERAGRETYEMDMANQREMLNAINAINKENLATGKARYASSGSLFGENQKSTAAANQQRTQTLGQMRGQDITADTAEKGRLTQMQIAKLQAATANRPSEAERIETNYRSMIAKGQQAEADAYLERIAKIKGGTGSERNDIKATETLLKNQQAIISDPLSSKADKEEARRKAAEYTQQLEKLGGAGGGASVGIPLPPNASAKNLVVDTVYQTAKGPAKWTGTGFMPI